MKPILLAGGLPTIDSATKHSTDSLLHNLTRPLMGTGNSWEQIGQEWLTGFINFGIRVVLAVVLFFLGRLAIKYLTKFFRATIAKRAVEGVAATLLDSLFVAILYIVLGISIAVLLGVKSVSFAAVLASMGLAIGMALSGQLQNLAGGVILMVTKPFQIGDFIEAQNESGTVQAVTLFHTRISTPENKMIFIPNGILSSGVVINYSHASTRRVEWIFGVEYGQDFEEAKQLLEHLINSDTRVLQEPVCPFVALKTLNASSVDLVVRAWVKSEEVWDVFFDYNRRVYAEFNKAGINFPFPQLTVHQAGK